MVRKITLETFNDVAKFVSDKLVLDLQATKEVLYGLCNDYGSDKVDYEVELDDLAMNYNPDNPDENFEE